MAKLISSIYGDALFDLALSEDRIDEINAEIEAVRQVFLTNDQMLRLLDHPSVVKEEKLAFISSVFGGRVSEEVMGFLRIIVEKDRHGAFLSIFDYFLHRVKEHKGIGCAHVASALPLTDRQKKAIEEKLLKTTDYKSFEMDYQVDPKLLGGLVIRIGDRIVDSSLKTQVDMMCRQLSEARVG